MFRGVTIGKRGPGGRPLAAVVLAVATLATTGCTGSEPAPARTNLVHPGIAPTDTGRPTEKPAPSGAPETTRTATGPSGIGTTGQPPGPSAPGLLAPPPYEARRACTETVRAIHTVDFRKPFPGRDFGYIAWLAPGPLRDSEVRVRDKATRQRASAADLGFFDGLPGKRAYRKVTISRVSHLGTARERLVSLFYEVRQRQAGSAGRGDLVTRGQAACAMVQVSGRWLVQRIDAAPPQSPY